MLEVYKWQEFENLGDDETIYKLMGPVLLKQDKVEAESTVKGRLDFITGEMYVIHAASSCLPTGLTEKYSSRLEGQIKEFQEKLDKKKTEIIQTQSSAQQGAAGKAPEQGQ